MGFVQDHLLAVIVLLPLLSALICLAFPRGERRGVRAFAGAASLVNLGLSLWMWRVFDPAVTPLQLTEKAPWLASWGIHHAVGVDGLLLPLIVLTNFVTPLVVLSAYFRVTERPRGHMVRLLLLQTGMLAAFVATDSFLFAELPAQSEDGPARGSAARTLPALPGQAGEPGADTHELYQLQRSLPWRAGRPAAPRAGGTP